MTRFPLFENAPSLQSHWPLWTATQNLTMRLSPYNPSLPPWTDGEAYQWVSLLVPDRFNLVLEAWVFYDDGGFSIRRSPFFSANGQGHSPRPFSFSP